MECRIYGVLDNNNCHIDIGLTERSAKIYANKNQYDKISYRIGYNAFIHSVNKNGKWVVCNISAKNNKKII
jgi:hypothetical protein